MRKLLFLFSVFVAGSLWSQPALFQHAGGYGFSSESFSAAVMLSDSSYLCAGTTRRFGNDDLFLVCFAPNGDSLWSRTIAAAGSTEGIYALAALPGGKYIAAAYSGTVSDQRLALIKGDNNGTVLWTNWISDSLGSILPTGILADSSEAFMVCGYLDDGSPHGILMRFSSTGNLLWSKKYNATGLDAFGGMAQAPGGYMILGQSYSVMASYENLLLRTDTAGNPIWARIISNPGDDRICSITRLSDARYIVTASTSDFGSGQAANFFYAFDTSGTMNWARQIPLTDQNGHVSGLTEDSAGIYTWAGTIPDAAGNDKIGIVHFTENGNLLWARETGGSLVQFSYGGIIAAPNHSLVIAGGVYDPGFALDTSSFFLASFDWQGNTAGCLTSAYAPSIISAPVSFAPISYSSTPLSLSSLSFPHSIAAGYTPFNLCLMDNFAPAENTGFSLSPQPFSEQCEFHFEQPVSNALFELFDDNGRCISRQMVHGSVFVYRPQDAASGLFLYRISENGKLRCTGKMIRTN